MSNSPTPSLSKNGKEDFGHIEDSPDTHINVGTDYANNVNAKYDAVSICFVSTSLTSP